MKHVRKVAISSTALIPFLLTGSVVSAATMGEQALVGAAQPKTQVTPLSSVAYNGGDAPALIKHAYGFDQLSETGAGQTVAVVEAYGSPTAANDLAVFDAQFGLPAANLTVATPGGTPTTDGGWALETSVDLEWAHAMAPSANLLLVEAKSGSIADLLTAVDYATTHGASVVAMDWGGGETSTDTTYESHFQHTGVAYVATSGQNGSAEWPASSPSVLSVGGNTLTVNANGDYVSENAVASGSASAYFAMPAYQKNLGLSGSTRQLPDVSLGGTSNGVAVYDSTPYNGQTGWYNVGGASISTSSWAALVALANQQRTAKFSSSNLLTDLYNLAGSTNYHIRSSSNNPAGVLGSPIANVLVPNLITAP